MKKLVIGHVNGKPLTIEYDDVYQLWQTGDAFDPPWRRYKTVSGCIRYIKQCRSRRDNPTPVDWVTFPKGVNYLSLLQ